MPISEEREVTKHPENAAGASGRSEGRDYHVTISLTIPAADQMPAHWVSARVLKAVAAEFSDRAGSPIVRSFDRAGLERRLSEVMLERDAYAQAWNEALLAGFVPRKRETES